MSGFDYNIGYLPGTEEKGSTKKLVKWLLLALAIFFAVQLLQATSKSAGDRIQSKASAVKTSQEIVSKSHITKASVSTTSVSITNVANTQEANADQSNIVETSINNSTDSSTDKDNENSGVFDEDLANLINGILPK
jgi:hypothetical protein